MLAVRGRPSLECADMSKSTNRGVWVPPAIAAVLIGGLALGSSCLTPADDPNSTVPGSCDLVAPELPPQKTDILFVIDNSNSMQEEQSAVATELPAFIQQLSSGAGV